MSTMITYADTSVCPACREPLRREPGLPIACPACALPLWLPLTGELMGTLRRADDLVATLRAAVPGPSWPPPFPIDDRTTPVRPDTRTEIRTGTRPGVRTASVPAVLLSLGALCLLVAAVAFLAVAWSWLGVGGRTAVLVALTATTATLGAVLARRNLRVAGEALTAVGAGLWLLDVVGADRAGWLGDLSALDLGGTIGVALAAYGLATAAGSRRLAVPQLVLPLGLLVLVVAVADGAPHPLPVVAAAVAGLALVAQAGRTLGLAVLPWSAAVAAAGSWLGLVALGLDALSALPTLSWSSLWVGGPGWALGLAAGYLLLPLVPHPRADRVLAVWGSAAAATGTALALVPATDESGTVLVLAALGAAVGWLLVAHAPTARRPVLGTVAAAPAWLLALPLAGVVLDLLATATARVLTDDPAGRLPAVDLAVHPLLLVPTALVVLAAAHLAVVRLGTGRTGVDARARATGLATALVAAIATVALHPVPVWAVLLAVVALALAAATVALSRDDAVGLGLMTAALAALAQSVGIAVPDAVQLTLVSAVLVVVAGACVLGGRFPRATVLGGALLPVAATGLLWSVAATRDVDLSALGVPTLVLVGALALALPRVEVEVASALAALVAAPLAIVAADHLATSTALHLTVAGALVTVTSLVHPSRRPLGPLGAGLLVVATWVRLADLGVTSPEAYTVPTALLLIGVGLVRLGRDRGASSALALAPGLSLLTVPSLLWVLATGPVSLRALLLGLACLVLVLGGAQLRWSAPITVGAAVGAVLALAELAPYVAQTPQWLALGAAGTVLTVVGVTWERRVADLRRASLTLGRLR